MIGLFYGYYSLLVYEIQAVYITLFLWNRDLLTFSCCFSHLLSEIMNIFLKKILKQPRPENNAPGGGLFEGRYGMPSQHCHCFAFLTTTILLLTFHYYRKQISAPKKGLAVTLCSVSLALQVLGRIYLKFHTIEQCLVGVTFGALSAMTFYALSQRYFMPHADRLCKLFPLRQFSFRKDLISPIPQKINQAKGDAKRRKNC